MVNSRARVAGEPRYQLDITEGEVLDLAEGVVQESLSRAAHDALGWRREQARVIARRK